MPDEIWAPVPEYEDLYQVSTHGRVRSHDRDMVLSRGRRAGIVIPRRGKMLALNPNKDGYAQVQLIRDGNRKMMRVHRLMLITFVGPPPHPTMEACHVNGVNTDNRIENLYWGTRSQNQQDSVRHGTQAMARRTHCPQMHPYDEQNTAFGPGGNVRRCRECDRTSARERARRNARIKRAS